MSTVRTSDVRTTRLGPHGDHDDDLPRALRQRAQAAAVLLVVRVVLRSLVRRGTVDNKISLKHTKFQR